MLERIKNFIVYFFAGILLYIILAIIARILSCFGEIGPLIYEFCFGDEGEFWAALFNFKAWLVSGVLIGTVYGFF